MCIFKLAILARFLIISTHCRSNRTLWHNILQDTDDDNIHPRSLIIELKISPPPCFLYLFSSKLLGPFAQFRVPSSPLGSFMQQASN